MTLDCMDLAIISLFSQDWEVAKVALGCQKVLDMLFQEFFEVERRRGWCVFLSASRVEREGRK